MTDFFFPFFFSLVDSKQRRHSIRIPSKISGKMAAQVPEPETSPHLTLCYMFRKDGAASSSGLWEEEKISSRGENMLCQ